MTVSVTYQAVRKLKQGEGLERDKRSVVTRRAVIGGDRSDAKGQVGHQRVQAPGPRAPGHVGEAAGTGGRRRVGREGGGSARTSECGQRLSSAWQRDPQLGAELLLSVPMSVAPLARVLRLRGVATGQSQGCVFSRREHLA